MPGRTIAIGDIHGCAKALKALIKAIDPRPDDLVIPLGDYVDRGPDSRSVIEQLIILNDRCRLVPLMGNHEDMVLRSLEAPHEMAFWMQCGGIETILSYGGRVESIPEDHIDFIRNCRRSFETDSHIFVHASYAPDAPLDEQPDHLVFWEHLFSYIPPPHDSGKTAIVGHTPQRSGEILDLGHLICIDTYCFGTGWLTAMDVESRQLWQVNKEGELRSD